MKDDARRKECYLPANVLASKNSRIMANDADIYSLSALVEVCGGYPFRGSVPEVPEGNVSVIQIRDVSLDAPIPWEGLVRTNLDSAKSPNWLRPGDVVFVARGVRNYAVCLSQVPVQAVCSQYFFLLRPRDARLLPEFLAWQINRGPARAYLKSNAEGSDQLSIRRAVLESLPIVVPSISAQRAVVALAEAASQEKRCLSALLLNRERQLEAIATDLFNQDSTAGNKNA